jgi:hypothetical protein
MKDMTMSVVNVEKYDHSHKPASEIASRYTAFSTTVMQSSTRPCLSRNAATILRNDIALNSILYDLVTVIEKVLSRAKS